jgi:hypothetical protein
MLSARDYVTAAIVVLLMAGSLSLASGYDTPAKAGTPSDTAAPALASAAGK